MSKNLLAIAWHEDAQILEEVAQLTTRPRRAFDVSHWLNALSGVDSIYKVETIYYDGAAQDLRNTLAELRPDIVLVFHGPRGAYEPRFTSALLEIAGWGHLKRFPPNFVFVSAFDCKIDECYGGCFRDCPQTDTVLHAGIPQLQRTQQLGNAIRDFRSCVKDVSDRSAPAVGLGVFLICNETGEVHLSERRETPLPRNVGTIGGVIYKGKTIEQTLYKRVCERFGQNDMNDFKLGPLLSCTNLAHTAGIRGHYVDLTFLATTSQRPTSLRSLGHRPIDDLGSIWFPFSRVASLSAQGRLFLPVENAYQALRRMIATHIATQERTTPLVNVQMLTDVGIGRIVREFDDADLYKLLNCRSLNLPRLAGFLFDQQVSK